MHFHNKLKLQMKSYAHPCGQKLKPKFSLFKSSLFQPHHSLHQPYLQPGPHPTHNHSSISISPPNTQPFNIYLPTQHTTIQYLSPHPTHNHSISISPPPNHSISISPPNTQPFNIYLPTQHTTIQYLSPHPTHNHSISISPPPPNHSISIYLYMTQLIELQAAIAL